jgi:choline dehydrogenase-like flavoprotein
MAAGTAVMGDILDAAGAEDTVTIERYAHLVGGCRMGFSPEDSVVDSSHRAWEVPNLFVSDGSVFPTEGAANPALVIMALADRLALLLKEKRVSLAGRRRLDGGGPRAQVPALPAPEREC